MGVSMKPQWPFLDGASCPRSGSCPAPQGRRPTRSRTATGQAPGALGGADRSAAVHSGGAGEDVAGSELFLGSLFVKSVP